MRTIEKNTFLHFLDDPMMIMKTIRSQSCPPSITYCGIHDECVIMQRDPSINDCEIHDDCVIMQQSTLLVQGIKRRMDKWHIRKMIFDITGMAPTFLYVPRGKSRFHDKNMGYAYVDFNTNVYAKTAANMLSKMFRVCWARIQGLNDNRAHHSKRNNAYIN